MDDANGAIPFQSPGPPLAAVVFEPALIALVEGLDCSGLLPSWPADQEFEPQGAGRVATHHNEALKLFSRGRYFLAHEHWESIWRTCRLESPARHAFQALIRLCAAGVKLQEGNAKGYAHHLKGACQHLATALALESTRPALSGEAKALASWKRLLNDLRTLSAA